MAGSLSNCSESHLLLLFFSARTTLIRFSNLRSIFVCLSNGLQRYKLSMNIFDVISYILRVKHKKVTKISILATQVYNIYSLGGLYVYPNILRTIIFEYSIYGNYAVSNLLKKQYIIAIYQINTNAISVQAWNCMFYFVLGGPRKAQTYKIDSSPRHKT